MESAIPPLPSPTRKSNDEQLAEDCLQSIFNGYNQSLVLATLLMAKEGQAYQSLWLGHAHNDNMSWSSAVTCHTFYWTWLPFFIMTSNFHQTTLTVHCCTSTLASLNASPPTQLLLGNAESLIRMHLFLYARMT
jgi:hypothetical protein